MKLIILFLLIGNCFFIGCNGQSDNKNDHYLVPFKKQFPFLMDYKWDVVVEFEDKEDLEFYAETHIGDTLLTINASRYIEQGKLVYKLSKIHKVFDVNDKTKDVQAFDNNLALLYWYKVQKNNDEARFFIIGKYYFLYKYYYLSEAQDKYFLNHKDSLTRIKGDNLPDLPEN